MAKHRSQNHSYKDSNLHTYIQGSMDLMVVLQKRYPEFFSNKKGTEKEQYDLFVFNIFKKLFAEAGDIISYFDKGQIPGYFSLARLIPKVLAYKDTVKGVAPIIDLIDKLKESLPALIEAQLKQKGGVNAEHYNAFKADLIRDICSQKDKIFKSMPQFSLLKLDFLLAELDNAFSAYAPYPAYCYDKKTAKNQSEMMASTLKFVLLQHCLNKTPVVEINTPALYELVFSLYQILQTLPVAIEDIVPFFNPYVVDFDTTSGILSHVSPIKFKIIPCEKDKEDMDFRFNLTLVDDDDKQTQRYIDASREMAKGKQSAMLYFGIALVDYFVKNFDKQGSHQNAPEFQRFASYVETQRADIVGFGVLPSETLPLESRLESLKQKEMALLQMDSSIKSLTLAQLLNQSEASSISVGYFVLSLFESQIDQQLEVLRAERMKLEPASSSSAQAFALPMKHEKVAKRVHQAPEKESMDLFLQALSSVDFAEAARLERDGNQLNPSLASCSFFTPPRVRDQASAPASSSGYGI